MYLEFSEWEEKYKPLLNHFNEFASYEGYLFETYGEELEFISNIKQYNYNSNGIWTLIEDGLGGEFIVPGYHIVNRLGYFLTDKPELDNSIVVFTGSLQDFVEEIINEFCGRLYDAIAHGESDHREWLLNKMRGYQNDYLNGIIRDEFS